MKTLIKISVCFLMLLLAAPAAQAQKSDKQLKKELKAKVDKDSKKTAKTMTKEGWKVMPGKLPLEKQIQASQYAYLDTDQNGEPLYIVGANKGIGGNYSAAKEIADLRARADIATEINNFVKKKISDKKGTDDFSDGDISSISETVSATESEISARMQGVTPILETYRETKNNTYEVDVQVSVNRKKAYQQAREAYRQELLKKSEQLAETFDRIMEE